MMRWFAVAFAVGAGTLQQQARLWTSPGGLPIFSRALPSATFICVGVLCAALLIVALKRRGGAFASASSVLLAFIIGFSWAHVRAQWRLADELPAQWEGIDVLVSGVVRDVPFVVSGINAPGVRFTFEVEQVHTLDAVIPRRLSLTWYADEVAPQVRPGERWQWVVRLKRPHGSANPYGFDVEQWLLEQNLRATGTVRASARAPQRMDEFVWSTGTLVDRARDAIARHIRATLGAAPYAGVIVALVVGEQRGISNDDWTVFNHTGIGHLLSISGLHITMLAAMAAGLGALMWRQCALRNCGWTLRITRMQFCAVIGLSAAGLYTLLAGFAVPAQRTLWMLAVVGAAAFARRGVRPSYVLCAALAIVVAIDPWAVSAPGFWLSFGAVAALMFASLGEEAAPRRSGSRWQPWFHALRVAVRAQLAVTLALAPMTLFFFQQMSLISPLANAIAIPTVSFLVTPLALLGGLAGPALGLEWPLHLSHWVFAALARPLTWLGHLPFASFEWASPETWRVVFAMLGLAWLAAPRGIPGRWAGLALFAPLLLVASPLPPEHSFRATALDVGQGMAVLIETAHHRLLYDTGPRYTEDADAGNRVVLPHLRSIGAVRLDAVALSHRDLDHAGGLRSVLAEREVGQVFSPLAPGDSLLAGVADRRWCAAGTHWNWDGVEFQFLHPPADALPVIEHTNAGSCVLRVSTGDHAMLLAGDIERAQEEALAADWGETLHAEALLVPHHGSASSSSPALLAAVRPKLAIIQVGYRNRFGHPRPDVLARYAAQGVEIARTDLDGAIIVDAGAAGLRIQRWRTTAPHYWQDAR